jgi:hypothetical protein
VSQLTDLPKLPIFYITSNYQPQREAWILHQVWEQAIRKSTQYINKESYIPGSYQLETRILDNIYVICYSIGQYPIETGKEGIAIWITSIEI